MIQETNALTLGQLEQLRRSFACEVVTPGDATYDDTRRLWNAIHDRRPAVVVRPTTVEEVATAIRFGRDHDLEVAVRSGGHSASGHSGCDGGLVIDLSTMRGVTVDPDRRTARTVGGTLLGELDVAAQAHGLVCPVGVIGHTGVAGLTLGGGVGWLVKKYGLTCDNVISFEIVTADGQVRQVSADEHPDLFWALRGGGGNFGVVTSFEYRLRPVSTVLGGLLVHPRDRAVELLQRYRDFTQSAPDEVGAYAAMLHTPDGAPVAAIVTCYCGDLSEGARLLEPLRKFGPPLVDAIQPMPFPQMQTTLDGAVPDGNQNYWKSSFLRELSDDAIRVMVRHANEATSPLSAVLLEQYGGAASRVAPTDTAFAQRHAQYDLGILAQWTRPEEADRHVAWARGFADDMSAYRSGDYLLNFLGEGEDEAIKAAFGPNYLRLVEVKTKYDPENLFRINQNIQPAAVAAG
jgi:hypothetical protein